MKIKLYGAFWCGDCYRIKFILKTQGVKYEYIDIDKDEKAAEHVVEINLNGFRSIPVLEFEDGTVLIEPSISEVMEKINK